MPGHNACGTDPRPRKTDVVPESGGRDGLYGCTSRKCHARFNSLLNVLRYSSLHVFINYGCHRFLELYKAGLVGGDGGGGRSRVLRSRWVRIL